MLRHACGFALAHGRHDTRAIQEWLGHRNIQHTTRYTELTTHRFKDLATGRLTASPKAICGSAPRRERKGKLYLSYRQDIIV